MHILNRLFCRVVQYRSKKYEFHPSQQKCYGYNKWPLISLNEVIGMNEVKTKIANKIITYLQGLGDLDDMNHIVIQAPPGYGKTMLAFHLSEIFYKMGLIKQSTKFFKDIEKLRQESVVCISGKVVNKNVSDAFGV